MHSIEFTLHCNKLTLNSRPPSPHDPLTSLIWGSCHPTLYLELFQLGSYFKTPRGGPKPIVLFLKPVESSFSKCLAFKPKLVFWNQLFLGSRDDLLNPTVCLSHLGSLCNGRLWNRKSAVSLGFCSSYQLMPQPHGCSLECPCKASISAPH